MTKPPPPTEKSKKQRDNTKTPPKTSIIGSTIHTTVYKKRDNFGFSYS